MRKAMVTVFELGLQNEVENMPPSASVWVGDGDAKVVNENPLGKVPILITRDGMTLIDSTLICEYLASLVSEKNLLPPGGNERWRVLNFQALAHGTMDALILRGVEKQIRPTELVWNEWIERQNDKIARTLDRFESMVAEKELESVNLGTITLGIVLGYLEQRFQDRSWRDGRSGLGTWFDEFKQRPSMQATIPPIVPPAHLDPRKN